jgi:hypothetical protein
MTDLEKELTRQIHEISKEVNALRERIAVLEYKATPVVGTPVVSTRDPWQPPYTITCAESMGKVG